MTATSAGTALGVVTGALVGFAGAALHLEAAWYWADVGGHALSALVSLVLAALLVIPAMSMVRRRSPAIGCGIALLSILSVGPTLVYGV